MKIVRRIRALFEKWEPYDPSWLVDLAKSAAPEEKWLPDALAKCTRAVGAGSSYVRFVDGARPNQQGSEWQFERNIVLEYPTEGEIVIDVLQGQRVGGIELLRKLT